MNVGIDRQAVFPLGLDNNQTCKFQPCMSSVCWGKQSFVLEVEHLRVVSVDISLLAPFWLISWIVGWLNWSLPVCYGAPNILGTAPLDLGWLRLTLGTSEILCPLYLRQGLLLILDYRQLWHLIASCGREVKWPITGSPWNNYSPSWVSQDSHPCWPWSSVFSWLYL